MHSIFLVALGGALGSVGRYLLSSWWPFQAAGGRFPLATLVINVLGCLLVGALSGCLLKSESMAPGLRLLLVTGLCGGFTTFSAFGLETLDLMRHQQWTLAGAYVLLSVGLGVMAVAGGFAAIQFCMPKGA